jgi:hypothetical protein
LGCDNRFLCTSVSEEEGKGSPGSGGFVIYESIKRKVKTRPLYECRCDERLKTKAEESTRLAYTVLLGAISAVLCPCESSKEVLSVLPGVPK